MAHVTKVQGADENNDVLDTADIYTDYTGGLASADAGNAKLLASVFADFQSSRGKVSKNGLVTVCGADGDMLSIMWNQVCQGSWRFLTKLLRLVDDHPLGDAVPARSPSCREHARPTRRSLVA